MLGWWGGDREWIRKSQSDSKRHGAHDERREVSGEEAESTRVSAEQSSRCSWMQLICIRISEQETNQLLQFCTHSGTHALNHTRRHTRTHSTMNAHTQPRTYARLSPSLPPSQSTTNHFICMFYSQLKTSLSSPLQRQSSAHLPFCPYSINGLQSECCSSSHGSTERGGRGRLRWAEELNWVPRAHRPLPVLNHSCH